MEPIQSSLKRWMRENKNFRGHFTKIKQELLASPNVQSLLRKYPELDEQALEKQLMKLYEYESQSKKCEQCPSLEGCINILPGYTPHLTVEGKQLHLSYDKCPRKVKQEQQQKQESLVKSLYMPKEILEASLDRIDLSDDDRADAIARMISYIEGINDELPKKGLYFHGPFGVGKTYFLGAVANRLSEKNIPSMIIYMPEFVREMKSSIKDDTLNEKIQAFKTVPVLMLDDIGAESQSAWFRDEILGSILQYRMMERLPVFFSSNYNMKELQEVFTTSNRGDVERVKASRIIERIKQVSEVIPLYGENRRY
ncbi:primosomal protein DnaI [Thalassobacillus devorans]|uniref:Primosomal protein DnaI n=1 Tax=Thalassobacillus devorans TaxID=279813 RepID=A0ABQ1P9I7_9BACI|nr:primosomal protein DnaI [Thalassobacillus devorans]NIK29867.1 primosomal protein DnaI [Thalassobacillus devorans]GGC93488.1 primosomal protein DnaI [Thalassobacillus devorans]